MLKMRIINKKRISALVITIITVILMIVIGPVDYFTHGYFSNTIAYDQISTDLLEGNFELENNEYTLEFTPIKDHFAGFEIVLTNQPSGNSGLLFLTIYDCYGKQIDEIIVDISEVTEHVWYKTYINVPLEKGEKYFLSISSEGCDMVPCLQLVNQKLVSKETISGNLLIGYAYKASTFNSQVKLLIYMFFIAAWSLVCGELLFKGQKRCACRYIASFMALVALLSWTYMYNSMDNQNTMFGTFQLDSEELVLGPIMARWDGVVADQDGYGLARYLDGKLTAYIGQYGLQGKIFSYLINFVSISSLHLLCCLGTATIFVLIVFVIQKKYNSLLAGCFLVVFWLSPWTTNFARNLYWVEFTWFLPMLIGLVCSWKIEHASVRLGCYGASFIAIAGKCLCGYEYISTIMMGLIAFLLVDWVKALACKNRDRSFLIFKTIFILGLISLGGFMTALLVHADLRGAGDIVGGIKHIFERDVLRRTAGADFNQFLEVYWPSFNASTWETCCKYFKFSTQIITGVPGNLFPLLCIIPMFIFVGDYKEHNLDLEMLAMYVFFFFASISWLCLAKSHSYIHIGMNYVLWYFGFVQICFYIIIKKIIIICQK